MRSLKLFTNPNIFPKLDRSILTRFLEDHVQYLPPHAAALLTAGLDYEKYCAAWPAQFSSLDGFGQPLLQALFDIETLALPENQSLLDNALAHLPPGFQVNRYLPSLHQALHLWLIAHGNHGATFPTPHTAPIQNQNSKTETSPQVSLSETPQSELRIPHSDAFPIKNQNSKIENPAINRQPSTISSSTEAVERSEIPTQSGHSELPTPHSDGSPTLSITLSQSSDSSTPPTSPPSTATTTEAPDAHVSRFTFQSPFQNQNSKIENSCPPPPLPLLPPVESSSPIKNQNSKIENSPSPPTLPSKGSILEVGCSAFDVPVSTTLFPNSPQPSSSSTLEAESEKSRPLGIGCSALDVPSSSSPNPQPDTPQSAVASSAIQNQNSRIENSTPINPQPPAINSSSDLDQTLERLAKLPPLDYDLVRRSEAKRLKLRLRTLDDAVERAWSLDDDAQVNAVRFRQIIPWPDPITDSPALFDEVHDRGLRYLYLPPGAAVVITVWAAHSHVIRAFTQTPRLNFTSTEPGCGKSTALSFLVPLCPKVLRTDNLKTPVLFRVVERHDPTVVLDEVDSYLHLCPDLLGLLNAGHDPDACVLRCEGNDVRAFKCFAATALAGIGHLSPTLRDRSIIIPLTKAPPGSLQARFNKRKLAVENILGQKIARWAQDNFDAIAACDPPMPAHNRLADNWRPLFAVAQIIGGHWPQRILDAFNHLTAKPHAAQDSGQTLLADIRTIFAKAGVTRVSCKQLAHALVALGHHPGGNSSPDDPRWLSRRLASLGIYSRNLRFGQHQAKGYELSDFTIPQQPSSQP